MSVIQITNMWACESVLTGGKIGIHQSKLRTLAKKIEYKVFHKLKTIFKTTLEKRFMEVYIEHLKTINSSGKQIGIQKILHNKKTNSLQTCISEGKQ
jgi:hypothetical protein